MTPSGTAVLDAMAGGLTVAITAVGFALAGAVTPVVFALLLAAVGTAISRLWLERISPDDATDRSRRFAWLFVAVASVTATAAFAPEPAHLVYVVVAIIVLSSIGNSLPQQLPLHTLAVLGLAGALLAGTTVLDLADGVLVVGVVAVAAYVIVANTEPLWRRRSDDISIRESLRTRARLLAAVGRTVDLDADAALEAVVDSIQALGFEIANVAVIRDGVRYPVATRGLPGPIPPAPADAGIAGRVFKTGSTVIVTDYELDPDRLPSRGGVRAAVVAPIFREGEVLGVVIGARRTPGATPDHVVRLLEIMADHAGHAIVNAERFAAQRQLVEQMRHLDQMKREFVANVSHELRTPLTVVKGLAHTLVRRDAELPPGRGDELLDRLNDNAARLSTMLASLLDFSTIEGPERSPDRHPIELGGLVVGVVERLAPVLALHEVSLSVDPSVVVLADAPMIEHVVENLVGNAAKHTAPGTSIEVRVHGRPDGGEVVVRDDGGGITAADLPRVTERYYRGQDRDEGTGTGLGLHLVAQVLEAHGTHLDITSPEGQGATFRFLLPRVASEVRP